MEEELNCSFCLRRAGNVAAPATLGNFAPAGSQKEEKLWMMAIYLGTFSEWQLVDKQHTEFI
jgi:hypothetical protein